MVLTAVASPSLRTFLSWKDLENDRNRRTSFRWILGLESQTVLVTPQRLYPPLRPRHPPNHTMALIEVSVGVSIYVHVSDEDLRFPRSCLRYNWCVAHLLLHVLR